MTSLTKTKLIAYLAVIFVAGAVSGAVITSRRAQEKSRPPSMEKVCHTMHDHLKAKLELTPEQVLQVQPILDQTAHAIKKSHARTMAEIDAAIERSHEEVAKYLTAEQLVKLEALRAERREWKAKRQRQREHDKK